MKPISIAIIMAFLTLLSSNVFAARKVQVCGMVTLPTTEKCVRFRMKGYNVRVCK